MVDTADIIAALDVLSADLEAAQPAFQARLEALSAVRLPLVATAALPRAFLDLERAARGIPGHRRTPLLRIREAVDLVRLNGELVHADTLLLCRSLLKTFIDRFQLQTLFIMGIATR
ncbi:MAG: hypothetical protein NXI18_21645 [Alphaproteobacteria bacterium]|nr:hypothetical protein [Alphaproteobacteria bacterium]